MLSKKIKYLAVFDLDGVIYDGHSIFDLIQHQESNGMLSHGTWETILLDLNAYKKGTKSYVETANSMLTTYASALKGKEFKQIKSQNIDYFRNNRHKFYDYFTFILKTLKKTHDIYIISTNFQFTVEAVCELFKLKGYITSVAEVKNGFFTGNVISSLAGNKDVISNLLINYSTKNSIAVGDSENDIQMLEKVEYPVCFQPNKGLIIHAQTMGWLIVDSKSAKNKILKLFSHHQD